MKKSILLLIAVVSTALAFAQAPNKMSYQSVIRNSAGALLTNQAVAIKVSILQTSASGTVVYSERHTLSTNANGLASLQIGGGTVLSGTFANINWGSGTYFVKTETDPNGGTNYSISGTQQLLSVPYALSAKTADALTGGNAWTVSGNNIYNTNSGNVGIGTVSPNEKLGVVDGNISLRNTSNANNTGIGSFRFGGTNANFLGSWSGLTGWQESGSDQFGLGFVTAYGASATRMYISATGKVGIGTTSPTHTLDVVDQDPRVVVRNTSTSTASAGQVTFDNTASGVLYSGAVGLSGSRGLYLNINGSDRLNVKENGNIGIATVSPAYLFTVNGAAGKPGGGSWTATSDLRLKDQIVPYADGLTLLMSIKPVKYHYNELSGLDMEKEYVGVIAQELQEVAPYMVGSFEKDGETYFDVDNSAMTYMLINAVQEQQKTIEQLQQQLLEMQLLMEALNPAK